MPVAYRLNPLYWHVLMQLYMLKLSDCLGKDRQVIKQLCMQYYATVATGCTGYVLYRALVYRTVILNIALLVCDINSLMYIVRY